MAALNWEISATPAPSPHSRTRRSSHSTVTFTPGEPEHRLHVNWRGCSAKKLLYAALSAAIIHYEVNEAIRRSCLLVILHRCKRRSTFSISCNFRTDVAVIGEAIWSSKMLWFFPVCKRLLLYISKNLRVKYDFGSILGLLRTFSICSRTRSGWRWIFRRETNMVVFLFFVVVVV